MPGQKKHTEKIQGIAGYGRLNATSSAVSLTQDPSSPMAYFMSQFQLTLTNKVSASYCPLTFSSNMEPAYCLTSKYVLLRKSSTPYSANTFQHCPNVGTQVSPSNKLVTVLLDFHTYLKYHCMLILCLQQVSPLCTRNSEIFFFLLFHL